MAIKYKVCPGDTLAQIAAKYDFTDWQALYFHPANDGFRRRYQNPSSLSAGAELTIPDRDGNPKEAVPLIEFILGEMNRNAASEVVGRINELNRHSSSACIEEWQRQPLWRQLFQAPLDPLSCEGRVVSARTLAMALWASQVGSRRPWDHKPILLRNFHKVWHQLGRDYEYYYDIWSNIHYGYVGTAAGFSPSALLDGAGAEQWVADLARIKMPQQRPGISGLRGFDDASDQESIRIGMRLFKDRSASVDSIRLAVLKTPLLSRRLHAAPDRKLETR